MIVVVGLVALVAGGLWLGLRAPARHAQSVRRYQREWRE